MADVQSEITVEVTCSKKKLFEILEKNGFFFKERLQITDYYYTHFNIAKTDVDFKTLSKGSFLIRNVVLERRYFSPEGITRLIYKKKDINDADHVQSETKIECEIDSAPKAKRIFTAMGLKNWCTKKIIGHVYKKGSLEPLIQEVEGVGLFIEIEQFTDPKTGNIKRKVNPLIKLIQDMQIPHKPDYHVNISYLMYLNQQNPQTKKPAAKKVAPKPKPKPAPVVQEPEPEPTPEPVIEQITPPEKPKSKSFFRRSV